MTPDMHAHAAAEAKVIIGLLDEWVFCLADPEHYAWTEGISRPREMTWVQFSEMHREIIATEITARIERLTALLDVAVSAS